MNPGTLISAMVLARADAGGTFGDSVGIFFPAGPRLVENRVFLSEIF